MDPKKVVLVATVVVVATVPAIAFTRALVNRMAADAVKNVSPQPITEATN